MRLEPGRHQPLPGPRELGRQRHRLLLQDLHPRRLPDLPVRAADPPPALPVPPVDLRPAPTTQGHLRPGRPPSPPAADHGRRRGLPGRQSDFTEPVGPSFWERELSMSRQHQRADAARLRRQAPRRGRDRRLRRRPPRPPASSKKNRPQGLPRPLVVHARRDRAVELRRPAAHRRRS